VVIEALAAGTPVIISDGVNIGAEIAAAGVGAVVSVRGSAAQNIEGLAQMLERWLGDADLRKRAAERARAYVWERYDWERLAGRWGEHYRALRDLAHSRRETAKRG
jgi:glycosyltransferase involved in cell wall biosynthesis